MLKCQKYAEGVEKLSHLESNLEVGAIATQDLESLCALKITLFLNLAASNLKLDNFDGSRRCCNVAILFSNKPLLKLEDMGVNDDLDNVDIKVRQPVVTNRVPFVVKALFRRGKSLQGLNLLTESQTDLLFAISLLRESPQIANRQQMEDDIKCCLDAVENSLTREHDGFNNHGQKNMINKTEQLGIEKLMQSSSSSITMENGGYCMLRRAAWTQSVSDATVYIPLSVFAGIAEQISTDLPKTIQTKWAVEFELHALTVKYYGNLIFYENLEHNIVPSQCLWLLEDHVEPSSIRSSTTALQVLVLYLHKAPSFEWFPGCEWWDRVFPADEPIDTLTCSIGTDVSQLPQNAQHRAQKEHGLFEDLDAAAQRSALNQLRQAKRVGYYLLRHI